MLKKEVDNLIPQFQSMIDQLRKIANEDERISISIQNKIIEQEKNINQLKAEIHNKNIEISAIKERANNFIRSQQKEIEDLKLIQVNLTAENKEMNAKIEWLKSENKQQQAANLPIKKPNEIKTAINSNVINVFNQWAINPGRSLPPGYKFIEGELKRRTNLTFEFVNTETRWIVDSGMKVLFPNPNFLDDVTDISEFYTMDITGLKPKGKNRIKIIEPCEIVEDGFIRFPGKLELL